MIAERGDVSRLHPARSPPTRWISGAGCVVIASILARAGAAYGAPPDLSSYFSPDPPPGAAELLVGPVEVAPNHWATLSVRSVSSIGRRGDHYFHVAVFRVEGEQVRVVGGTLLSKQVTKVPEPRPVPQVELASGAISIEGDYATAGRYTFADGAFRSSDAPDVALEIERADSRLYVFRLTNPARTPLNANTIWCMADPFGEEPLRPLPDAEVPPGASHTLEWRGGDWCAPVGQLAPLTQVRRRSV